MPRPQRAPIMPAAIAMAAIIASFVSVYLVCKQCHEDASAAMLAAVLALSLSRRHIGRARKQWMLEFATLPVMALTASGVGWLLRATFPLGATVFILGMAGGMWLRRFGPEARKLGSMIMLPLVAMLVVPVRLHTDGGMLAQVLLASIAGMVAFVWVLVLDAVALRQGWLVRDLDADMELPEREAKPGQIPAGTRLAAQMATALAASFTLGRLAFGHHWAWVVITAFIVSSRSAGRSDAVYKGVQRLAGAIAGTLCAALCQWALPLHGPATALMIFAALFIGIWQREANYAIWAGSVTLIIALLQQGADQAILAMLGLRLLAIVVGAACSVAAAWWVLPIPTESVVRRYLADALQALEAVAEAYKADKDSRQAALRIFQHRMVRLETVAPPVHWHHRLSRTKPDADHPAIWIATARQYHALIANRESIPTELIRTVRLARRTLGQRDEPITHALQRVQSVLSAAN